MRIFTLDNTFGYSPGRANPRFTLRDRVTIVHALDRLGIDYVEAGCPAASASVRKFFALAQTECRLIHTRLVASARLDVIREPVERDEEIQPLLEAATPVVTLSTSCWRAGADGLEPHFRRVGEAVRFLKSNDREVIVRVEDFFNCYCANPQFALHTLESAKQAGADMLCLRDANGRTTPQFVREICLEVRKRFEGVLGICAQDDSDLAVANTLEAVGQGFTHVEGSINAYGARRGLANLCSIISNLENQLGHAAIEARKLAEMTGVARLVAEASTAALARRVQALSNEPNSAAALLERVDERLLGGLTEAGRRAVLDRIKLKEREGYELRTASGSLELLVREELHPNARPFEPEHYEVTSHGSFLGEPVSTATVMVRVGDSIRSETEQGAGPVNALERCLHQCLFAMYPEIASLRVVDYRVQVLDGSQGTAARVRVSLEWRDLGPSWMTAGVSEDLLEATWRALVDGVRLSLMRLEESAHGLLPATDSSWAV